MSKMDRTAVREQTPADIPTLAAILVDVYENDGYPVEGIEDPEAWLTPEQSIIVWTATLDDQPVGQVALSTPGPGDDAAKLLTEQRGTQPEAIVVLGRLFIAPNARGHSLGRRLTEVAMHAARSDGRISVLDVMAKDQAAISLYEELGWELLGVTTHETGSHAILARAYVVGPR